MQEERVEADVKEIIKEDLNNLPNRIIKVSGATASIAIIATILYIIKFIPSTVSIAISFFISLPLMYSFIFGIITNRPNFSSTLRHYSFLTYLLVAFIIYLIVLKPISILSGLAYSLHFFIGLIIAVISFSTYVISYNILRKYKYRVKASISFIISLIIALIIAFVLEHFSIFDLIK